MCCMNVLNQTTSYQHGMPLMSLVHIYRKIPLEASNYQAINVTDYRLIAFAVYGAAYSLAAPVYFMPIFNILITSNCIKLVCGYWTCKQGNFGTGILGAPFQNTFSIQWITTEHPNLFINQVHDLEKFPFDLWTPHISGHNSSHFSMSCMFHYLVASYVLGYYINCCTVFISSPPGQNDRHFADDIFKCIFVNEKFCILIEILLRFILKRPIDNNPELV